MPFMSVTGIGFNMGGLAGQGYAQITDLKFIIPNYTSELDSIKRPKLGPGILWAPPEAPTTPKVRVWFPVILPGGMNIAANEFPPVGTGIILWGVNWPTDNADGSIELMGGNPGLQTPGNADPRIPLIGSFIACGTYAVDHYNGGGGLITLKTTPGDNTIYSP